MLSKSEWHRAKVIKITNSVLQGGADVLSQPGSHHGGEGGQAQAPGQEPQELGRRRGGTPLP